MDYKAFLKWLTDFINNNNEELSNTSIPSWLEKGKRVKDFEEQKLFANFILTEITALIGQHFKFKNDFKLSQEVRGWFNIFSPKQESLFANQIDRRIDKIRPAGANVGISDVIDESIAIVSKIKRFFDQSFQVKQARHEESQQVHSDLENNDSIDNRPNVQH